ncbi:Hps1-dma1 cluster cytochrome monooxygenase cyp3.1 like protein [Verticillium longisporum]|nr:Hps1-dma1 cluster cytochrome monooxygenase cyp3.1 like protein [Verticillium longisporum]
MAYEPRGDYSRRGGPDGDDLHQPRAVRGRRPVTDYGAIVSQWMRDRNPGTGFFSNDEAEKPSASYICDRQCDRDTTVLGRAVPKGTTMLLLAQGPSLTSPALRIPEAARSPSARPCGAWDPEGMELFAPERWLSTDGAGNVVFDPLAGPVLGFGGGVRGCFGRKLAYLEMRIVCTLLAWNFELLECGEELSGYEAMEEITYKPTSCYMKPRKWEDA